MMKARIDHLADDLSLITLNPPIDGFEDFISSWLYQGETCFLVDVGPASTADGLLKILDEAHIDHLDYILLTHIHLDHAGAIGEIAAAFPQTPIICHPAGIPHLVEPARLWEGTKKVLGSTAEGYGPIQAVAGERFVGHRREEVEDPERHVDGDDHADGAAGSPHREHGTLLLPVVISVVDAHVPIIR